MRPNRVCKTSEPALFEEGGAGGVGINTGTIEAGPSIVPAQALLRVPSVPSKQNAL